MTPSLLSALSALDFSRKIRADCATNRTHRSLDLSNRSSWFLSNVPLFPHNAPPLLKTANRDATSTNRRAVQNCFGCCYTAQQCMTHACSVRADSSRRGKTIGHPRQSLVFSPSLSFLISFSLACVCPVSLGGPEKQNSRGEKREYVGVCLLVGALLG